MVERLSVCNSEREFQDLIVDLARANGWKIFHLYHSVRGGGGFPDLTLVHAASKRLVYAELKLNHKSIRPVQREWLDTLRCIDGVEVYIWRPRDAEKIMEVISGKSEVRVSDSE